LKDNLAKMWAKDQFIEITGGGDIKLKAKAMGLESAAKLTLEAKNIKIA
jgi:hypothetical protein